MGALNFSSLSVAKMAFTDLIPALLGATGTTAPSVQNVKNFFNNVSPSTSAASTFQNAQNVFQGADFLIGQVRNPVVQLFLNPDSIQVNKSVLLDKKQTRGGFVVQFWGHELQTIEVKAATAYFEISKEPLAAFELLKRQVYQGRFSANQPFKGSPIIGMLFETQVLKGYFNDFSYSLSSAQPFYFTYNFKFTVTENLSFVVGSNLTNLISDTINLGSRLRNSNATRSDVTIVPDNYQFGKGWGVQLF